MRTAEDLTAFALKNGIDPLKFVAAYNSFGVQSKAAQARQTASAYKIDAVPAMGVQGRYYTNGTLANAGKPGGSVDRMLGVVDVLVARVRQGNRA
jgi:thiol:disulfide interchange protein DsbA